MSGNYQTPRVPTVLDERKLNLTARPVEKGAKPPSLKVGLYRQNPNITVFTNVNNGSGVTSIRAGMDAGTFATLIQWILYLAHPETPPNQGEFENKKPIPKEQRSDPSVKVAVASKTKIGKDDDGRIWISILDPNTPNAPRIQFYFGDNYYHSFRLKDESKVPPGIKSQMAARGWATYMQLLVFGDMVRQGATPSANTGEQNGGNKSYGGQNKGNYGGKQSYGNKSYGGNSTSAGHASTGNDFDDGDFGTDDF